MDISGRGCGTVQDRPLMVKVGIILLTIKIGILFLPIHSLIVVCTDFNMGIEYQAAGINFTFFLSKGINFTGTLPQTSKPKFNRLHTQKHSLQCRNVLKSSTGSSFL